MASKKKLPHNVEVKHPSEKSQKETHRSQVEQEQTQKRTFTNWINAQLSKRRPPVTVLDLFDDLRDGSRLLDLLEVMSGQKMSREKGRGTFQHRTNIEKALAFLKKKSIKLVNINVSDIMDGKPSIILGLVWTVIMHFHIEELASTLSFSSRQSSMESLASLDSLSTTSSARSSPVPPHGSPLHTRFRVSAKKALLLWVREQCHRAGCTLNVKDFKGSWRSGVVFLAILSALRPNSVDLTRARTRTNRQNLEEAFHVAERELHIPRLLDPADVDVRDPDEKSIMTYVAQFLQYSKDTPASDEEMQSYSPQQRLSPVNLPSHFVPSIGASPIRQTSANQKAQEVTCWLTQAYQELIEGWDSTEGESYAERYHVFHTFIVSFNEQRRPVMPLLTAMKRTTHLSAEQKALRQAWDTLAEKLREYKTELDLSLPSPLDSVGRWLLRIEEVLSAEEDDSLDHAQAAEDAHEKIEQLKVCLEEMPHHIKRFNMFQNTDEFGETLVPRDKMEEIKRRFTSVRVTAKYHIIKMEYQERRHTVLDLLNQLKVKLRSWERPYISQESVRVLMQDWNETVNNQELASMLDGAFQRLKHIANKYTSKAALAEDSNKVNRQVAELEEDVSVTLEGVRMVKGSIGRVLGAWETYSDTYTSLHAWLEQGPNGQRHGRRTEVTSSMMSEWSSRQAQINEVGNYLIEVTDPQTSRAISDELCKINLLWADFAKIAQFAYAEEPNISLSSPQTVQALIREANQLLKEPVEMVSVSLRTYTKRLQLMMKKIKDIDLEALSPSIDCSRETLNKLQQAIPEVLQTLSESEQVCDELRLSVSGLDSRLAELLLWETEARELYQILKEETRRRKRGQDSRVRLLISRGLQLEGQVVMEEQDLQMMVMMSQKSSPLQYLIASNMQDRVRTTVEKSQEAVGMLSSLGAFRDRSPVRDQQPAKTVVQPPETREDLQIHKSQIVSSCQHSPSGAPSEPDPQPTVRAKVPASSRTPLDEPPQAKVPRAEPFNEPLPMIVIQEYKEDKSPQPQEHHYEQWEHSHSQFTKIKTQEVVQSEAGIEIPIKSHEGSQQSLPQPVTQQHLDTKKQLQVEVPVIADQPASQAHKKQQLQAQTTQQEQIQVAFTVQKQQVVQGQVQTPAQPQVQPQLQKVGSVQHQQQMKERKSQARNRPWLQQKAQLESAIQNPSQMVASHSELEYKGQISFQEPPHTVATSSAKAGSVLQSETKPLGPSHSIKQYQPLLEKTSKTSSGILLTQNQPIQPVPIHRVMTQQHQNTISTQAQETPQKEQVDAQIQQQIKPPTQGAIPKQPQALIQKKAQHQSIASMQPHVVTQWQPQQTVAQTPLVILPQRFPVSEAIPQRSTAQHYPISGQPSIQPQVIMQSQRPTGFQNQSLQPLQHYQSVIPPQPKRTSPITPRIISMPQPQMPQPQMPVQSQIQTVGPTQLKASGSAQFMVPPKEQPQWDPIKQTYPQVQGPIPLTSHTQLLSNFQNHPQSQNVHPAQHQQWPPIRQAIVTQTYSTLQPPHQVQVQSQMPCYTETQQQPQQWPTPGREPLTHPYRHIRPQGPVQDMVPRQHWRPVSPVYPLAETQSPQYSQYQALQRPQSPQQPWSSVRNEHQTQAMFQGISQPVAPWNHPPAQASIRPLSPQQSQQSQQQQSPPKTEASSKVHTQTQSVLVQSRVPTNLQESEQVKQPTLAQAPPQTYTEAYKKAQALVRNRFEEAKHCLQEHIIEAISVFKDKQMTSEQASVKEETLKALDSELLEEFLRAAEGMEAFCTPSELRDMEFFTQSVRTQWKTCFSAEGSLAQAGQQLEALKELCDTLSPEDAHRLAQAQLRECERRLAAIQRQFSGDQDTPPADISSPVDQTKEPSPQNAQTVQTPAEKAVTAVSPPQPRTVEKREIVKQTSTEEDRYRSCRFALLAQLNRNEQCMLGDRTSESVTSTDLQKRLRELKSLWDETESLWKEYETTCMQCVQFKDRNVDQDRMELTVRWREQRSQLQRRVESLGAALELMDSIELKISEISEKLDKFIKEPKDIKGYTLANPTILKDVKELDESIQAEMDRLSRFDSEPSHLDLRDRSPLTQVVLNHRSSLDRLRQQVRKSDAAARALDRFLMSLRTVELDVSSVQSTPSSDPAVLQDSRSKLTLIRKGVSSLNDKAPQLDQLLGGAQLEVTQEERPVSCLDMVGVLVRQVEEVDDRLMVRQKDLQKETQSQGLGLRRKSMMAELRKVQGATEKQGLKDPTLPALQQRMRSLSDLESQLNSLRPEYQSIKMALKEKEQEEELSSLWDETERAVSDRQEQCTALMELLKKFQSCRSYLGNTLQRAEQTINEQASYMGKDNLQRLLAKVIDIKDDLGGLGSKIEEFRAVCRQLQSQLRTIPDCSETPFETEADGLVDSWLDVSEKTDSYLDNLRMGLELWEKQLLLGGEVDSWSSTKLIIFSESHPLTTESEVLSMKNEIQNQEDNIEHFHRKLLEIQELLQSKESPLELQVMETNLRKKMEQVKELFSDCTDVFEELLTVKAHLNQKIDISQSYVENIRSSLEMVHSKDRIQMETQLQNLCKQLLDQEEQADALLKEITLMFSITGPQAMEDLINHNKRLKESIAETKELIRQKKDQKEKTFLQTIKEKFNSFEEWLQDEQLSVNECFENPERREDVEASMQRLTNFLASKEGEQRLGQLKEMFERGGVEKIPSEAQALLSTWQQEQEGELATLRAHCHGRHKQLDDILDNLNNLQEARNHLKDWLQKREEVPTQREKLRHLQDELLQESGRVEAFHDLLSNVRMRGLRGDPLLKDSESLIDQYHSMGIILENQAQVHKGLDDQAEKFQTNVEITRSWIRDLKQELETLEADTAMQEKQIKAQAVINLTTEADAKLVCLKKEVEILCACEILEDTRKQEFTYYLRNTEDEWKRVWDIAQQIKKQADLQDSLSKELQAFQAQEESFQSWIGEQLQILLSLGKDLDPQEKLNKVQGVLDLNQEASSRLTSLKRQGQISFSYKELDNERRSHIDQIQNVLEEEWRKVVKLAQELENQVKHEDSLSREIQTFCDEEEDTRSWIRLLKENLSIDVASSIQERMNKIEEVLAHRSEADCKLADLKRKGENLCSCKELKEDKRLTVQQNLQSLQEEWTGVMTKAQELKNQSELEVSLSKEFQELQELEEHTQSWIRELQRRIGILGEDTQIQERMIGSQAILNSESGGEYKLTTLRKKAEGLCSQECLGEKRKQDIHQNLKSIEEEWKQVMAGAQELKNQAQLQESLSRELEMFHNQEKSFRTWLKRQQDDLESLGKSSYGTQEQIEGRLNKAQQILNLRSEGKSQISDLKGIIDELKMREDLSEEIKHSLIDKMKCLEAEWKETLQQAQELNSLLRSVVERMESCHCQKEQLLSSLEQVKQHIAALPHHFPWPGLGDRRHTVEQARNLLDRTRALTPSLSALRALGREMSQLTRDSSWIDPSWATMEECIPELIKELTDFCVNLEEEIRKERVCAQLVEQHTVAQDWLREQIKGFGALPTERRGLQNSVNTLKALLQTVEREKREMRELEAVKNSLMDLCTPGGRDSLTLEVSHLHDLCISSEEVMREQLAMCEARLGDIELRISDRAKILRAQAESLLGELHLQDNSLEFLESSQNISQLQENWHKFKICEREIEALEGKVRDVGQVLRMAPTNEEPPFEVISLVDNVTQQYCSLRSKLLEKQNDCADSTVKCVRQALQSTQSWDQIYNANPPCNSATSMQAAIEEGAKLRKNLQVALSHKQLLRDCLGPDLAGKLERDGTKTLNETETSINVLKQELKNLEETVKQETVRLSLETQNVQLDSQDSTMTTKVKFHQPETVSSTSLITESCVMSDDHGQAYTHPFEKSNIDIPVCEMSETITEITHKTKQSPPMSESDNQQGELQSSNTETVPELDARECRTFAVGSSSEANKGVKELRLTLESLETMAENNEVIAENMLRPSSETLEATVKDIELDCIKMQERLFSMEVLSFDSFSEKVQDDNIELVTAEKEEEKEAENLIIPDFLEKCGEDGKKVATLILDVDNVHIHSVDKPTGSIIDCIISTSRALTENTLSKMHVATTAQDSVIKIEASSTKSSVHEPSVVYILESNLETASDQSQLTDIDTNKLVRETQSPYTETESSQDARGIGMFALNYDPKAALANREGNWTTDNGPHELQHRCIILDVPERMEIQRYTANYLRQPTDSEIQGTLHPESERVEKEGITLYAEDKMEVLDNTNKHLGESEMAESVEAILDVPTMQKGSGTSEFEPEQVTGQGTQSEHVVQLDKLEGEDNPEDRNTIHEIVEEETKITPSDCRPHFIEAEPRPTPPVRRRSESKTNVQLDILPTPPSRRRNGNRLSLNLELQISEGKVLPTPPTRRRREKMGSTLSLNMETQPTPPARRHKDKQDRILSLNLETQSTIPTRTHKDKEDRRLSLDLGDQPTPPARRRKDEGDRRFSLNLGAQPTPPARRRKDEVDRRFSLDLGAQPTPPARRRKDEEDRRFSLDLGAQPTPPARTRKPEEDQRFSLDLGAQPTLPARRNKDIEDRRFSLNLGAQPALPERRHKDKEDRRFSLDLSPQPTLPERRHKDKEDRRLSLDLGAKTPPPDRRSKEREEEKFLFKLETQQTYEQKDTKESQGSVVNPTPPDRSKTSRVEADVITIRSKDIENEEVAAVNKLKEDSSIVKYSRVIPSPPNRVQKVKSETDIIPSLPHEPQVIPTPSTRKNKDESETESMPEYSVIPVPSTKGKNDESETYTAPFLTEDFKVMPTTVASMPEDPRVIPTPPTRRKKYESETDTNPLMSEDSEYITTSAAEGKKGDSETNTDPFFTEDLKIMPTPPTKIKKDESESAIVPIINEDPRVLPTPPTRRKEDESETDKVSIMPKDSEVITTSPTEAKKDKSDTDTVKFLTEDLEVISAIPMRRKKDKSKTDTVPLMSEDLEVIPPPPTRRKKDESEADSVPYMSEDLVVKLTPPTRRNKYESKADTIPFISENVDVMSTSRTSRKTDECETDTVPSMSEDPQIIPNTQTRRKKDESETDTVFLIPEDSDVILTPPTKVKKDISDNDTLKILTEDLEVIPSIPMRREKDESETDTVPFMSEDLEVIPTSTTRRKKDECETAQVPIISEFPQAIIAPPIRRREGKSESDTVPLMPQNPQLIPTPPTRRKKDEYKTDTVPSMSKDPQLIPTPPTRRKKDESETETVPMMPEDSKVINTPPTEGKKEESDPYTVPFLTENLEVIPAIPMRRKKDESETNTVPSMSEDLEVIPTPLTSGKKDESETAIVPILPVDPQVIPTPPTKRKKGEFENDAVSLMHEDSDVIPTPPTRKKKYESKTETETDTVPSRPEDPQVTPTPPTWRKKDESETDPVQSRPEGPQFITPLPTKAKKDESETETVTSILDDPQAITTSSSRLEDSSELEESYIFKVEANVKPEVKQEDGDEQDLKTMILEKQLEEGQVSITVVQKPTDVVGQTERINYMQEQKVILNTENFESSREEVEELLGPTMQAIFMEIKHMTEKEVKSVLIEGMPHKSTLEILHRSSADLEARLKRLVFHLLDLRNHPATLNSREMAKQLEEAEECRTCAQTQVSLLSKQVQTNGDINTSTNCTVQDAEHMQQLSAQWSAALWDAASAVHSKEAQLKMVADFERQTQRFQATLERLRSEWEELKRCPAESCFVEEERLHSFLRNMEQERSALGELIQTHAKLSPHLSMPDRQAAEIQQNNLLGQWRMLEIDAERALYNVNAFAKESAILLQEIRAFKDHLENIQKTLKASKSPPVQLDSKRAEEIMNINADFTSAQQQYLNLQQISGALTQGFQYITEASSIDLDIKNIKDKLDEISEQIAAETPTSSNPMLSKIVKVITDALAWAKQTQCNIKGRLKKVSLLPEEVHRQIKDLKKLQLEMNSKQTQLRSLVEEVTELIPELEKAYVPMVTSSLKSLEDLSKSTARQLAEAVREMESGLQTREKMSEQIADVDSWIRGLLQKEALRREDYHSLSVAELDRRLRQIQETIGEAEKHCAVSEALLMKSRDISSELSVSESSQLNEKLTNLQEDIKNIISYEKTCCQKVMDVMQGLESSQRKVSYLENSLRQMLVDVKRHRFPVTKDTLSSIEPFKQMVVERKSQIEQVSPCPEDKRKELLCVITELHHHMNDLDLKAQEHERYLSLKQCVEDLMEDVAYQIQRTKDESIDKEDRYRDCQSILTQMLLIKLLCEESRQELLDIAKDLYPSQLSTEETRLKQILENLKSWELAVNNNLRILEWDLLKHIHYPSELKACRKFLEDIDKELENPCYTEPKERVVEKELRMCFVFKKNVEFRMRVLEYLEKSTVSEPQQKQHNFKQLTSLKDVVLDKCDQRMVNLTEAKDLLRNYNKALINTVRFLQRAVLVVLPSVCSARSCSERLKDTEQALSTLGNEFQSHISQLQNQVPQHPCFKQQKIEFLQTEVVGELLVRLSILQAQAQIQLETLMRCVECQKHSRKCYEDLCQQVRDRETSLSHYASNKITSHKECKDQQQKLKDLVEEVDMLPGKLKNLKEWCPLHGCRANREDAVSALWGQAARLQRCASDLQKRTEQMENEWSDVTNSMDRATTVLEQVEAELPDSNKEGMTAEELQELLVIWSQYQDRLDCEHRALSALELRAARLLGIPAHLEKAPSIAICQEFQSLHKRYHSVKERSAQGQRTVTAEVKERERVQEQLFEVREWLDAAFSLLSVLEHEPSKKQLQEVHSQLCSQKAVLQRISEGLKMMYSDRNTLVPEELEGLLKDVSNSLQEAGEQVESAVEKSGPLHRLAAKISGIKAGLGSVQSWLEQKSLNFSEAENTHKRIWDELEGLHTRLTAVEVELQDMSEMNPDETRSVSENFANAQQAYSKLTKQAEQRTSFLNKVRDWLQEHEEMVKGSQSWISEAQSWLTTPCTYTTAKCLDSHVNALQMVLDDSAQMRRGLKGFGGVLTEMASVFDVSPLEEQLANADGLVADMQHSLLGPLSQLEHAASEVDAIEAEIKVMEKDVAKIKSSLTAQEGISRDKLEATENRIDLMKKTVAEIQNCKEGLCLPDKAENKLLVFKRAELLQKQLLELEQLALEYSIEVQEIFAPLPDTTSLNVPSHSSAPLLCVPPTIAEEETQETGEIQIVHVEEDALKKSGATLMTVEPSSNEQRLTWISERGAHTPTGAEESDEVGNLCEDLENTEEDDNDEGDEKSEKSEDQTDDEAGIMSASSMDPDTSSSAVMEETVSSTLVDPTEQKPEHTEATDSKQVAVDTEADTSVASGTEASSEATEKSESHPADMVTNTSSVTDISSSSPPRGLQRCLVS